MLDRTIHRAHWRTRSLDKPTRVAALLVGMLLLVHLFVGSVLPWWQRLVGAIPGVVAIWVWTDYFKRRHQRLPFREYAALQFYVYWGLPALTYQTGIRGIATSDGAMTSALVAAAVVALLAVAGHPLGLGLGRRLAPVVAKTLPRSHTPGMRFLFWPWLAVATAVQAGWVGAAVPDAYRSPVNLLGSDVPLLVFAWLDARGGEAFARLRLVVATAALSIAGFFTGMMEAVLAPVLVVVLASVITRRRVPWRLALAGILIVVVVNPAKHAYRQVAWERGEHVETDPSAALANWGEAFRRTWLEGEFGVGENLDTVGGRLNELAYLAPTFELCPSAVPHRNAAEWSFIPLAVVPRALFPEKPDYTELFNARYNVAFGFQSIEATKRSTSSFPLVADGYWNLGWPGVVLVGFVAGLLMGIYGGAYTPRTWGGFSLAAASFVTLHAHGHLARLLIGTLQQYVAIAATCWVVWLFGLGFLRRSAAPRAHSAHPTTP